MDFQMDAELDSDTTTTTTEYVVGSNERYLIKQEIQLLDEREERLRKEQENLEIQFRAEEEQKKIKRAEEKEMKKKKALAREKEKQDQNLSHLAGVGPSSHLGNQQSSVHGKKNSNSEKRQRTGSHSQMQIEAPARAQATKNSTPVDARDNEPSGDIAPTEGRRRKRSRIEEPATNTDMEHGPPLKVQKTITPRRGSPGVTPDGATTESHHDTPTPNSDFPGKTNVILFDLGNTILTAVPKKPTDWTEDEDHFSAKVRETVYYFSLRPYVRELLQGLHGNQFKIGILSTLSGAVCEYWKKLLIFLLVLWRGHRLSRETSVLPRLQI